MKLPRLSEPTVYKDGDLEVTVASQFDLLPAWTQWALITFFVITLITLVSLVVLRARFK